MINIRYVKSYVSDVSSGAEWYFIPMTNTMNRKIYESFYYRTTPYIAPPLHRMQYRYIKDEQVLKYQNQGCCCKDGKCSPPTCDCAIGSQLQFDSRSRTFNVLWSLRKFYPTVIECGSHCKCKGRCGRVFLYDHTPKYQYISYINNYKKFGVRSAQHIQKGAIVSEYSGVFSHVDGSEKKTSHYCYVSDKLGRIFEIDAKYTGNISRFYNHSCAPNLGAVYVVSSRPTRNFTPVPRLIFIALDNLLPEDELTIDYGETTYSFVGAKKTRNQKCYCYEPECRWPADSYRESYICTKSQPTDPYLRQLIVESAPDLGDVPERHSSIPPFNYPQVHNPIIFGWT